MLLYEVAITRVLSVVLWYHFAFLSISLAMLGVGASGVWFAVRPPGPNALRVALIAAAASLPLSVIAILRMRPAVQALGLGDATWIAFVAVAMLAPMLALGSAICILLIEARGRSIGRMYGADLLGAMLGALLAAPLLYLAPTPQLIAALAGLPIAALIVSARRVPVGAWIIAAVVTGAIVWGEPFAVVYNKSYDERTKRPLVARWTPTARITLFDHAIWSAPDMPWLWGMGQRYTPRPLPQWWIDQDGSAGMPIEHLTGEPRALEHLMFDVTSVGYQVAPPRRVCVIGAGGGRDVLTALAAGAAEVDAVELNPTTVALVSGAAREFSGDIYHYPGVRAVISEGRSYLTRAPGPYDMIQISLVDSWAATAAGAYALSENFLYTQEALQLYWSRLSDDGMVSISRFSGGEQHLEGGRLAHLARSALVDLGVDRPKRHLAFVQTGPIGTLLMSRREFTGETLAQLDAVCEARGFTRCWPAPQIDPKSAATVVLAHGIAPFTKLGLDFSPPTDDRPFFFQTVSLLRRQGLNIVGFNERAAILLRSVVVGLTALAAVMFFAPFLGGAKVRRKPGLLRGSAYFAAIGLAFMSIEMPWIERSILQLGHATYATSTVLGSLLLGAGLGSITAGRLGFDAIRRWRFALPLLVAGTFALSIPVFQATLGLALGGRIAVVVAMLLPTGWVMGFAFPCGMMRFGDDNKAWFWAINGAFGVLAGALSLAAAMVLGFTAVAGLAVCAYVAAAALVGGQAASGDPPTAS